MAASLFEESCSSMPMLGDIGTFDDDSDDDNESVDVPLNASDGTTTKDGDDEPPRPSRGGRPALLQSKSLERVFFGNRLTVGGPRRKTYLNKRFLKPAIKNKNQGSVLKSLGKFLGDEDDGGDEDKDSVMVGGGMISKILGSRLGKKKRTDEGIGGFLSLDDDEEVEGNPKKDLDHAADVPILPTDNRFSSIGAGLSEKPTSVVGGSLQFGLSLAMSNHSNHTGSVSALSIGEMDDLSQSSDVEESSLALNDSFASIGSDDLPEYLKDITPIEEKDGDSPEKLNKSKLPKRAKRKSVSSASSKGKDQSTSTRRSERTSSSHGRSRSRSTRESAKPLSLSSRYPDISTSLHSTRSTKSTWTTRSTKSRRASSRGAVRNRPQNEVDVSPNHSRDSIEKESSTPARPMPPCRHVDRSSSARDLRQRYKNRANLHRQILTSKAEASTTSQAAAASVEDKPREARPQLLRQNSLPAIRSGSAEKLISSMRW